MPAGRSRQPRSWRGPLGHAPTLGTWTPRHSPTELVDQVLDRVATVEAAAGVALDAHGTAMLHARLSAVDLLELGGFATDTWQARVARDTRDLMIVAHRQAGKSVLVAALALEAVQEPDSKVLIVSPSERQSGLVLDPLGAMLRGAGDRLPGLTTDGVLIKRFANGSRIEALPGRIDTVRGFSGVRLLIVDEAAYCPPELWFGIRPMVARSRGRKVMVSTPAGKAGWFYDLWMAVRAAKLHRGATGIAGRGMERIAHRSAWGVYKYPVTRTGLLSEEFLERERQEIPDYWWRQEYACEFLDPVAAVFADEHVAAAFDDDLEVFDLGSGSAVSAITDEVEPVEF